MKFSICNMNGEESNEQKSISTPEVKRWTGIFGGEFDPTNFERRLENSKPAQKARTLLRFYGYTEAKINQLVQLCVHEVSPIMNKYALAWEILPNEMARLDTMSCKEKEALNHIGLVFLDLDNLKGFNDLTKGEAGGNWYLDETARILSEGVTTNQLENMKIRVAPVRWGGDEFCILLSTNEGQGTLNTFGEQNNNVLEMAINGWKREVSLMQVPDWILDKSRETLKKDYDKQVENAKKVDDKDLKPTFSRDVLDTYLLVTSASFGSLLMSEIPKEHIGPFVGENQAIEYENIFMKKVIELAASRAKINKSREREKRSIERPIDAWAMTRTEEQQLAEGTIQQERKTIQSFVEKGEDIIRKLDSVLE